MSTFWGGRCLGGHESSERTHRHPRIRRRDRPASARPHPVGVGGPDRGSAGLAVASPAPRCWPPRRVAAWLTGHGWLWPDSPHLFPALGGLLTGHVGAGLDAPDGLPSPVPGRRRRGGPRAGAAGPDGRGRPGGSGPPPAPAGVWGWPPAPTPRLPSAPAGCAGSASSSAPTCTGRQPPAPNPTPSLTPAIRRRARTPARRTPATSAPTPRSVADSVDAGIAAARVNRVRFQPAAEPASETGRARPTVRCIRPSSSPTSPATPAGSPHSRFSPAQVGWRLGSGAVPRSGELWVPFDRTDRRVRAAGIRQDPRPADSGAAVRTGRGAGHVDQGRGPAADRRPPCGWQRRAAGWSSGGGAGPVRSGARAAGAGVGPGRRVCGLDGRRTPREGVHRRHRPGCGRPRRPGTRRPGSTPPRARRCCRRTSTRPP